MKPKNIKIILIILLLSALVILESCKCYNEGDPQTLENGYTIQFRLFDKDTKEALFGFGAKYNFDSVLVYDANGALIYPFTQDLYLEMVRYTSAHTDDLMN